jgi:WD40 repeat protein
MILFPVQRQTCASFHLWAQWPIGRALCRPNTALVSGFLILVLGLAAAAQETSLPGPKTEMSSPRIEPVDFVPTAGPPVGPADPGATSSTASPGGWGFAVFSPDSKLIAAVTQPTGDAMTGEVFVWNAPDATMVGRFAQRGRIAAVVFSPDGKRLAIGPDGPQFGVTIIDTKTGDIQETLPGPAAQANCLAWSGDGKRLALGSTLDKSVREWDVAKKRFIKAHEVDLTRVLAVGFSKDGTLLAIGLPTRDRVLLHVVNAATGGPVQTLTGHKEMIEAADLSADGTRIVSAGWDATVRVWDVAKGESIAELKGHKRGINTVSHSSDGRRIASANPREFKLWDGEKKDLIADLGGENNSARFVAMSPNGAWLVSIARDGSAHLWDVEKQSERTTLDRDARDNATADVQASGSGGKPAPPPSDAPELEAIQSLAYSRDGKWLAIAREDGRISIRTAADGKISRELAAFGDVASSVAFSPDSRLLASGSFDKVIKIWKVDSGEQVAELPGHSNWVFGIAFSPDGETLSSASYDKTVKLWNVAEATEIATLKGHTAGVRAVTFTKDGKLLISAGSDRTAIVWNLETGTPVTTLKGHTAAIRDVVCSPDGGTVATASEDSTIKLWKTADWSERAVAKGAEGVMFWCLAFSPQGRTLAGGAFDGTIKLFDPSDGRERSTLRGPTDAVTAVAFAPDAHEIIAGSIDKSYRRWKAQKAGADADATGSTGETGLVELKPAEADTALKAVTLTIGQPVLSLAFDTPGRQLAVGTGGYRAPGSLQMWDAVKHERKWQSPEFKFGLPGIAFSPSGRQIAVGNFADNFVRLYITSDGEKLKELRGHRSKVHAIAYSANGTYFATASLDGDIKLWDAATNREVKTFAGHKDYALSIEFSPDGKLLLSASADRTARLWNVETGKEARILSGHTGLIQQATFSSDGSRIATASSDGTSRVYEAATGDYLFTLRGHRSKIEAVAFSPGGRLIATGSGDRTIRLWDAKCGAELLKLAQEATVRAVLFSRDGKQLASGSDDKTVKLWDVTAFGK